MNLYGTDLFGNPIEPKRNSLLAERFYVPPFSVLNAREGWWQERKQAWESFGIQSEVGRNHKPHSSESSMRYAGGYHEADGTLKTDAGKSVFDCCLTELAYRWFCPPGGQILDPFAGGSVRGIVASLLGYRYWGCDLRQEQIDANREQATKICPDSEPVWVCGDSNDTLPLAPSADFVFSCPPYGDLERYSDDPRDLSTMDYHAFVFAMRRIVLAAAAKLKPNRFACFVVGDFRDKRTGFYRNFVSDTIESFTQCGMHLYNEAILVTQAGSLPIRITKQFDVSRKLGKTHQNVLVFVKGCPREATRAISQQP